MSLILVPDGHKLYHVIHHYGLFAEFSFYVLSEELPQKEDLIEYMDAKFVRMFKSGDRFTVVSVPLEDIDILEENLD